MIKGKHWGALAAAFALWIGGCAAHIKDVDVPYDIVVPSSQKLIPLELAYFMDVQYRSHTEAVGLGNGENVRLQLGKMLNSGFEENLRRIYQNVTVLPNNLFAEKQWPFDYPGTVIAEIENVAINPANLSTKLSVICSFYVRGRRKVGEARFVGTTSPLTLDAGKLSDAERKVLESNDRVEKLKLSLQLSVKEILINFLRVQPQLLKPESFKGQLRFASPYRVPPNVDFKPYSLTDLADAQAKKELEWMAQVMHKNPDIRVRIEVHAFDYLGKVYEYPPKILAPERASVLKKFLIARGISGERVEVLSLEDFYPMAENTTEKGWDRNDRVDFVVLR